MTPEDGELCARVLASICWADDTMTDEEVDKLLDLFDRFEYCDRPLLQEILHTGPRFTFLDRIKRLDPRTRLRLLHDAYLVGHHCGGLTAPELEIIRQIAATVVPAERWGEVEPCLKTYVEYETKASRLWGVTHLG